ncbi:MAG: NYN domain-containing protein [Minisyncoccales bacterium]
MRYFIDGNNLGLYLYKEKHGCDVRAKVLNFLSSKKIPKMITVVFDGFNFRSENEKGSISIIFSKKRKADEVIIEKICKGDIVVTNDRELQSKCRTKGAIIVEIASFISNVQSKLETKEKPIYEPDVEGWMKIFSKGKNDN